MENVGSLVFKCNIQHAIAKLLRVLPEQQRLGLEGYNASVNYRLYDGVCELL